jgi:hypothetical protein
MAERSFQANDVPAEKSADLFLNLSILEARPRRAFLICLIHP